MAVVYVSLPLYSDADYSYEVALEGNYYTLRLYYNERAEGWYFELSDGESEMLVAGERLVPYFPILKQYKLENITGMLWLESIGYNQNQTVQNPFELSKYYNLYYIYDDGEED